MLVGVRVRDMFKLVELNTTLSTKTVYGIRIFVLNGIGLRGLLNFEQLSKSAVSEGV